MLKKIPVKFRKTTNPIILADAKINLFIFFNAFRLKEDYQNEHMLSDTFFTI